MSLMADPEGSRAQELPIQLLLMILTKALQEASRNSGGSPPPLHGEPRENPPKTHLYGEDEPRENPSRKPAPGPGWYPEPEPPRYYSPAERQAGLELRRDPEYDFGDVARGSEGVDAGMYLARLLGLASAPTYRGANAAVMDRYGVPPAGIAAMRDSYRSGDMDSMWSNPYNPVQRESWPGVNMSLGDLYFGPPAYDDSSRRSYERMIHPELAADEQRRRELAALISTLTVSP